MMWYPGIELRAAYENPGIIYYGTFKICRELYSQLYPLIGSQADEMYKGLRIEFEDHQTQELKIYNAIGLSYPNRNVNVVPADADRLLFRVYSGVVAMEISHSIIHRLTNNRKMANDLVHYGYNIKALKDVDYVAEPFIKWWGGSIKLVVPDLAYLWTNKEQIMAEIEAGRGAAGPNEYWSDRPMAAENHELEHIKEFIVRQLTY